MAKDLAVWNGGRPAVESFVAVKNVLRRLDQAIDLALPLLVEAGKWPQVGMEPDL